MATMITNELKLKQSIMNRLQGIIFEKEPDVKVLNESKLLIQFWVFNPYIKDALFDELTISFKNVLQMMTSS